MALRYSATPVGEVPFAAKTRYSNRKFFEGISNSIVNLPEQIWATASS